MDFPRFMMLLENHTLFFSKATNLGSKYEGEYSYVDKKWNQILYKDNISRGIVNKSLKNFKYDNEIHRECVFINCWHINDHESNLLWNYYAWQNGIAIQSTFGNVIKSFNKTPETIFGGPVNYIDYFEDSMPDENILFPFVHKPLFFKDEHELRFLTYVDPNSRLYKKYLKMNGKNIQIDIDILIESIFLFPSSELWIYVF